MLVAGSNRLKRVVVSCLRPDAVGSSLKALSSTCWTNNGNNNNSSCIVNSIMMHNSKILSVLHHQQVRGISLNRRRKYMKIENKAARKFVCKDDPDDEIPIEVYANNIDTTLTPEQKEYVESLKRKMNGSNSARSLYRQVAMPGELETNEDMDKPDANSFLPLSPNNPNALIDWALSHVPKRDGKRGTREKHRMEQRQIVKRENDQIRIKNVKAARERQLARNAAQKAKAAKFVTEGVEYRKKLDEKKATLYQKLGIDAIVKERLKIATSKQL